MQARCCDRRAGHDEIVEREMEVLRVWAKCSDQIETHAASTTCCRNHPRDTPLTRHRLFVKGDCQEQKASSKMEYIIRDEKISAESQVVLTKVPRAASYQPRRASRLSSDSSIHAFLATKSILIHFRCSFLSSIICHLMSESSHIPLAGSWPTRNQIGPPLAKAAAQEFLQAFLSCSYSLSNNQSFAAVVL